MRLLISLSSFSHASLVVSGVGASLMRRSIAVREGVGNDVCERDGLPGAALRQSRGLDGLSALQVAEHLVLYAGYVRQVNILNDELAALRAQGRVSGRDMQFAELTRRLGYEYNGMILHEYYFSNLRGGADPRPAAGSAITAALRDAFGSVERWQTDFRAIG